MLQHSKITPYAVFNLTKESIIIYENFNRDFINFFLSNNIRATS